MLLWFLLFFGLRPVLAAEPSTDDVITSQGQRHVLQVTERQVQVLSSPWQGRQRHGVIFLLAHPGIALDNPGFIHYLRRAMNPLGWASFNLTPPRPLPRPGFVTDASSVNRAGKQQLGQPANQSMPKFSAQALQQYQARQQQTLSETLNQLTPLAAQYPGKRIWLASGQSAALLAELLAEQKLTAPDLLVVFNPYPAVSSQQQRLTQNLHKLRFPVLDFQSPDGHPASTHTLTARQQLAGKKGPRRYRQYQLALDLTRPDSWQHSSRVIHGFARSLR